MHRSTVRLPPRPHRRSSAIERLEPRQLMSGTWSTVDGLPLTTGGDAVGAMTADNAGNVYAIGSYNGSPILREKPGGSSSFATVPINSSAGSFSAFGTVFVDANGNLFLSALDASGYARAVLER